MCFCREGVTPKELNCFEEASRRSEQREQSQACLQIVESRTNMCEAKTPHSPQRSEENVG